MKFTMKTMKSKKKVETKQKLATMKFTMKKFQLVRKYANYPTWDEKQNLKKDKYYDAS